MSVDKMYHSFYIVHKKILLIKKAGEEYIRNVGGCDVSVVNVVEMLQNTNAFLERLDDVSIFDEEKKTISLFSVLFLFMEK